MRKIILAAIAAITIAIAGGYNYYFINSSGNTVENSAAEGTHSLMEVP